MAIPIAPVAVHAANPVASQPVSPARPQAVDAPGVDAQYRQGTPAASRAYWAVHEARVRAIKARIEARWHRLASR